MPISRAVPSNLTCSNCRNAVIRSFTSINSQIATYAPRASLVTPIRSQTISRAFGTTVGRRHSKDGSYVAKAAELDPGLEFLKTNESSSESQESSTSSTSPPPSSTTSQPAPIPWYLQAQRDRERTVPVAEQSARELIPDLPPNPPPLLQTLLEYISITAGLDDLALMDLRDLNPPPALGPKLIMIIGTARSEKHLHVSADRFCRWLRREHGLRANAAGLLGRNELKIKLRRKAKRMKMLANVGGQEPEGNIDDGIRTGWICCTIGKIEPHPEDMHMPGMHTGNFVGFNDVKPGVNVVVQMFTEEKRGETDLETLWGGVVRTHERNERVADEVIQSVDEAEEAAGIAKDESPSEQTPPQATQATRPVTSRIPSDPFPESSFSPRRWNRDAPSAGDVFPPSSNATTRRQTRRLHTVGLRLGA